MNREKYYNYIEEKLYVLYHRINNRGKLNILDYHVHSENFYRDFFNLLYHWELENLNAVQHNVEGIDLIDNKNNIIVQVSATNTKNKINSSLEKESLKTYQNYTFKFIAISDSVDNLKGKTYKTPSNINFNPQKDIYGLHELLSVINNLSIDDFEKIYDFIKKELESISDVPKLSSDLNTIINILAKEDLNVTDVGGNLNTFQIEKKIQFNKLNSSRLLIEDYKIYCSTVEKIYSNYDEMGLNKSLAVLNTFRRVYINNMDKYTGDDLYKIINENILEKIKNNASIESISEEELCLCVDILMVDAFIRCKIFENPNNYAYAITR